MDKLGCQKQKNIIDGNNYDSKAGKYKFCENDKCGLFFGRIGIDY